MRPLPTLVPLAVALALAACTGKNTAFCDQATACADPDQVCDLTTRTCEPLGFCSATLPCDDPARPSCDDGTCVGCQEAEDCGAAAARCDDLACAACQTGEDCARFADTPQCGAAGACVECRDSGDCGEATPVCDATGATCRTCADHEECTSGVCNDDGTCLDASAIVYVTEDGANNLACSQAQPCATITQGLSVTTPGRMTVKVGPGSFGEALDVASVGRRVVGSPGTSIAPPAGEPALLLSGTLALERVELAGPATGVSHGVELTSTGELELVEALIRDFARHGVRVDGGTATLRRVTVRDNAVGVGLVGGALVASHSIITGATEGALLVNDGAVDVANTVIHHNGNHGAVVQFVGTLVTGRLVHTTIAANEGGGDASGINCALAFAGLTLRNNIIHGNSGTTTVVAGCGVTYTLTGPTAEPGTGNTQQTPVFVDADGGDFHLAPGSPGIDVGLAGDADDDLDGDARPRGTAPDLGADEAAAP